MKKVLLASTILVGTAGFAAADSANFSFSGEADFGVAYNTSTKLFTPTVGANFTAGMSTSTDMGLEAGASVKVTAGGMSIGTDNTSSTFGATTSIATTAGVGDASVYLSGDFGKLTVSYDGGSDVNYRYAYTFGDFTIDAGYDWNTALTPATKDDVATLKVTYAFGDYKVYAGLHAAEYSTGTTGWVLDEYDFGASASMSGFSLAADLAYVDNDAVLPNTHTPNTLKWKVAASYASGAYSVGAFVQDDLGTSTSFDYGVNAAYDLGGGVSVKAGYIYDADTTTGVATAGVSMSF